ncbi:HmuY family protein [Pedobacter metabolipauper]|uniref:Heme-binding HmuY-like protein n=1 Tax=Pedobacter metabolipauper TaxID=425513 RepID=A0A4R6SWI3_9SPHI|nr:HmuY family protein [Pedobacter metabolipauper]TDQ08751.1 heme-binding HmuY-like protein [Pedobacter metabolipauper]
MNKIFNFLFIIALSVSVVSCEKSDPPLPDNLISFAADKQGLEASATESVVNINLSRATDVAIPLTVTLTGNGVAYGTEFTTDPIAVNNTLALTIPAGSSSVSFKVKKVANAVINGTESIDFTIATVTQPILNGTVLKSQLSFAAITSDGAQMTLNGIISTEIGASAGNSVFVDFSGNAQVPVDRDSWDLGFYSGTDFKVILNASNGSSVIALAKTDLNAVTAADFDPNTLKVGQGGGTFALIDDPREANILNKTAIAAVSAADAENKVYIINRKGGSNTVAELADLYKIKVIRKGTTGYSLQYAKVSETTFKTIDITKDNTYNFQFASLVTNKVVNVEPAKAKWDLVWGYSMYLTGTLPYGFSDLVFINSIGGVQAAEVLTATVTYADYKESNIATTEFKTNRDVIGSNWRVTSGGTVGVKTDRFYVLKDASGNVYKLKFINFHPTDGGVRGKPLIEYKLVKKA